MWIKELHFQLLKDCLHVGSARPEAVSRLDLTPSGCTLFA
jgi:hypothetical protein